MKIAIAVIADDLTGANATGVLLGKQGYRPVTLIDHTALPQGYDVLLASAESRAAAPEEAARRVREGAGLLLRSGPGLLGKRIDSTLRGNLGAETDAMLQMAGEDAVALVVPAFPASGRTTIGGRQFVHGVPLEETDVRHDPTCPVNEGEVAALLQRQSRFAVAYRATGAPWPAGARIVICDATTDADLEALAREAAAAPFRPVPVDPGPFTAALATVLSGREEQVLARPSEKPLTQGRILAVAGSRSSLTAAQLAPLGLVRFDPGSTDLTGEDDAVRQACNAPGEVVGVQAGGALIAGGGPAVAAALGRIALAAIRTGEFGGLYTTGGDVTVAVCRALGATGIELNGEVLPLASYGRLVGGPFEGLAIVTKGGLVGGPDAALACVNYLKQRMKEDAASDRNHHGRPGLHRA